MRTDLTRSANQSRLNKDKLDALTSVRFFFAMMVLLGHFYGRFSSQLPTPPLFVFTMAPLAVSWFFVLSGFILAYNYGRLNTNGDRAAFLFLRVARLWPVHCTILTVALLLQLYYAYPPWLRFQYTMTQSWSLNPDIAGSYNGPAWSISDEFFFYIAYIGVAAPSRWVRIGSAVAVIGIGFWAPLLQGCQAGGTAHCNYWTQMFPPTRFIEFLAGVVACRLRLRIPQIVGLCLAAAALFNWVQIPYVASDLARAWLYIATNVIGGVCLIASLARDGWLSRMLCFWPLIVGGEISYSMYMTHEVVNTAVIPHIKDWGVLSIFAATTTITLTLSTTLFYVVEAPGRNAAKWLLRGLKSRQLQRA